MTLPEPFQILAPLIFLLLVGVLAIAATRPLRLSPIVGYLIAGALIGPRGFRLIEESPSTQSLALLGVVFLLFDIGLHFSLAHMWAVRRDLLGLGPLQVLFCAAALGGLAVAAGLAPGFAFIIGVTLALSSTAVALQTVAENGQKDCPIGATATAVLIFQDICAIFLLILANSLEGDGSSAGRAIALVAIKGLAAFGAAMLLARFVIGPFLRLVTRLKNEELFTAVALLVVLVTSAGAGALGLSLTLGAFLGGMIIAETPYRYLIQTEVKPFRGLLLGFFFITVGMTLDPGVLLKDWRNILLFLLAMIGVKVLGAFLAARALRSPWKTAIQLGFLLSQGSEFAFVVLAVPAAQTRLGPELAAVLITVVAASMALTPPLAAMGHWVAMKLASMDWEKQRAEEAAPPAQPPPIVIVGMGEIGRRVADALEARQLRYMAIEMNYDSFVKATADGYPVAFGDAADLRLMETIGIGERPTVVITIPRYEISREITPILRERYPNLTRFIAVETDAERERFEALGMKAVVSRSVPKGLDLASAVLKERGVEDDDIREWMRRYQDEALEAPAA